MRTSTLMDGAVRPARFARIIGAFLVLTIVANAALGVASSAFVDLRSTAFLCLWLHAFVSIFDGVSGRLRTLTWLLLCGVWVASEAALFLDTFIPWGQIAFWVIASLATLPVVGSVIANLLTEAHAATASTSRGGGTIGPIPLLLAVAADFFVLHLASRQWTRSATLKAAVFAAAALLAGGAVGNLTGLAPPERVPSSDTFAILPPWYALPYYAILRAVPDKTGGLLLMACILAAPAAWPWVGASRARNGRLRLLYGAACATFAMAWIGLCILGAGAAAESTLVHSRIAAAYVLAFFVVIVPLIVRFSDDGHTAAQTVAPSGRR
ncbi:hypothetical protein [Methylobacterium bullatum]